MCYLLLIVGLVMILAGANALTDGASSLAKGLRIPSIVIGLTVVSFGTSVPELTVSLTSALRGSGDMAVGNVVGSNLFNTLMIVGCTALVAPIRVKRNTLRVEIPLSILVSVALLICCNGVLLNGAATNVISRSDGLLLLCFFAIFMGYIFAISKGSDEHADEIRTMPLWRAILFLVGGLVILIVGGEWFVDGATEIARRLGVSESIIALTLVAGGTSLPELATSLVAAHKGNSDIAIGNAIGSNIFNVLLVLGCSATVTPLEVNGIGNFDLLYLVGSGILLSVVGVFFGERIIMRVEGAVLVACYIFYLAALIFIV
jgi:cation:H+ antiporter